MEDIFEEKICSVCKKYNLEFCPKKIQTRINDKTIEIFCNDYKKDQSKIKPYVKPLEITAKRDYLKNIDF